MERHDLPPSPVEPPPRGWLWTFFVLGTVMALDGVMALIGASALATPEFIEALGKALVGPMLVYVNAIGLLHGRVQRGRGLTLLMAVGACLYLVGMVGSHS